MNKIILCFEIEQENIRQCIMIITLFQYNFLIMFKFIQIETITAASWKGTTSITLFNPIVKIINQQHYSAP